MTCAACSHGPPRLPVRKTDLVQPIGSIKCLPRRDRHPDSPDRVRHASVPENGRALFDYLPDIGEGDRKLAVAHGDGWRVPPRPASFFAVNAADAPWVDSQCTGGHTVNRLLVMSLSAHGPNDPGDGLS